MGHLFIPDQSPSLTSNLPVFPDGTTLACREVDSPSGWNLFQNTCLLPLLMDSKNKILLIIIENKKYIMRFDTILIFGNENWKVVRLAMCVITKWAESEFHMEQRKTPGKSIVSYRKQL